jgi:hypothetical protein
MGFLDLLGKAITSAHDGMEKQITDNLKRMSTSQLEQMLDDETNGVYHGVKVP